MQSIVKRRKSLLNPYVTISTNTCRHYFLLDGFDVSWQQYQRLVSSDTIFDIRHRQLHHRKNDPILRPAIECPRKHLQFTLYRCSIILVSSHIDSAGDYARLAIKVCIVRFSYIIRVTRIDAWRAGPKMIVAAGGINKKRLDINFAFARAAPPDVPA